MQVKSKLAGAVVGTAIIGALVVAGGSSAGAKAIILGSDIKNGTVTSADIKNQTITSADIAAGGVGASEIRNGSVGTADLSAATKAYIASKAKGATGATGKQGASGKQGTQGKQGPQGIQGKPGDAGKPGAAAFVTSGTQTFDDAVIEQLGGSWKTTNQTGTAGHTKVGQVDLKAGTYLLSVNSGFWKSSATDATPSLQVQVNSGVADGFPEHTYVTTFTGGFPAGGSAGEKSAPGVLEQTSSGYAIVTLAEDTTIEVDAFGYNADQSDKGSGDFSVSANLSWVQVNAQK